MRGGVRGTATPTGVRCGVHVVGGGDRCLVRRFAPRPPARYGEGRKPKIHVMLLSTLQFSQVTPGRRELEDYEENA